MSTWIAGKRFDKTSLPDKKAFYNESYLEYITDEDYTHVQKAFEKIKLKNLGNCYDLYVQNDTLLLADAFENFRNKCIEIYKFNLAHFLSVPWLALQACLKKTGVRLKLLTNINMLLMLMESEAEYVMKYIVMQIINTWRITLKTLNYHI